MRGRIVLATAALAAALTLSGCQQSSEQPTDTATSLEEYAKQDCEISMDGTRRLAELNNDVLKQISHPEILADTVVKMAQVFRDIADKGERLGDAPNGEGAGGTSAAVVALRQLATDLDESASGFRASKSDADHAAALTEFQKTLASAGPTVAEFKSKYPTPKLDEVEKAIPGCRSGQ